jgi:protein-S-isoprenylcysteine O-methyltransferase Ste14
MTRDRNGPACVVAQLLIIGLYLSAIRYQIFDAPIALRWIAIAGFVLGLVIMSAAAMQLNKHLSPLPKPKEKSRLITSGAYKSVRHPIYAGLALLAFAWAILKGNPIQLALAFALAGLLNFKAKHEEKLLERMFSSYSVYGSKTGELLPRFFWRARKSVTARDQL